MGPNGIPEVAPERNSYMLVKWWPGWDGRLSKREQRAYLVESLDSPIDSGGFLSKIAEGDEHDPDEQARFWVDVEWYLGQAGVAGAERAKIVEQLEARVPRPPEAYMAAERDYRVDDEAQVAGWQAMWAKVIADATGSQP
jgi:hypothetical protein